MTEAEALTKASAEVTAGRPWRAKEILRGNIASRPFSPLLFEHYGRLLLSLGDQLEAGKYLFLSGVRSPEYEEAIAIFLKRMSRAGPRSLFQSFPPSARLRSLDAYPASVEAALRERGVRPKAKRPAWEPRRASGWVDRLALVGCGVVVAAGVVVFSVGLATIFPSCGSDAECAKRVGDCQPE